MQRTVVGRMRVWRMLRVKRRGVRDAIMCISVQSKSRKFLNKKASRVVMACWTTEQYMFGLRRLRGRGTFLKCGGGR